MVHPARFVLTTLALSVAMLPAMAFAVEVEGVIVENPPVESAIEAGVEADFSADWEQQLRSERARRIADLRAYADAGVFPQKPDQQGFHHQFLDASGRPCAVASLIMTSGRADLVQTMAQLDNAVVVSELESGPIVDWVLASGLTMEEIAVIQVPGWTDSIRTIEVAEPRITRAERREQARVRRHLEATLSLLEADTEASIWKAMQRLGDARFEPPPGHGQS